MRILYEYRADVRRQGLPDLRAKDELDNLQGFTSLYGFDDEAVKLIEDTGRTRGLSGYRLYSDILYIDIDGKPELIEEVRTKLNSMGLTYEQYASGSPDSGHFHLPMVPMYGENIQYIQKQYVKETFGTQIDLSIYKTSGIIRLNGSYHKKYPGKRKNRILSNEGEELDLTDYESKVKIEMPRSRTLNEDRDYSEVFDAMLMSKVHDGDRHNTAFKMAAMARDSGYNETKATDILMLWNNTMVSPPLSGREMISSIRSAYKGR